MWRASDDDAIRWATIRTVHDADPTTLDGTIDDGGMRWATVIGSSSFFFGTAVDDHVVGGSIKRTVQDEDNEPPSLSVAAALGLRHGEEEDHHRHRPRNRYSEAPTLESKQNPALFDLICNFLGLDLDSSDRNLMLDCYLCVLHVCIAG